MQILSDKTDYTWQERLKYFGIGASKACGWALYPALIAAVHNWWYYSDATDWRLVWELAFAGVTMKLKSYWNEHKALLQMPPAWAIPAEFEPSQQEPPKP